MDKKETPKERIPWWIIVIAILWVLYYLFVSGNTYRMNCVDTCVSSMGYCPLGSYVYGDSGLTSYISEYDYDSCQYELESCISDC